MLVGVVGAMLLQILVKVLTHWGIYYPRGFVPDTDCAGQDVNTPILLQLDATYPHSPVPVSTTCVRECLLALMACVTGMAAHEGQ